MMELAEKVEKKNVEIKCRRRKMSKVKHLKEKHWVKFQDVSNKTVGFILIGHKSGRKKNKVFCLFHFKLVEHTLKKKGTIRNLKKVSRIETNSKPFLGFVQTRFHTTLFFLLFKKGFVVKFW